ncbi:MAG: D-glycerate dehydrogenase [Myxococcales bacterium]|nr:D-glycerate dehydrogenase [Myxococcales bacterium]MCB9576779.1 D-glycerate dehydrogenase [Polyangiaceae bacterium]
MSRVVVTSPLPGDAIALLERDHAVRVLEPGAPLAPALADADALLCMLTDPITDAILAAGPSLRIVANCAVGFDNVDVAAATARGIWVVNTPNVLTEASADFAWALMLAAARRIVEGDTVVRSGRFQGFRLGLLLGAPVAGQTLGIVGLGRIGQAVARRARGFDMRVLYAQRHRADAARENELRARHVPLAELLSESDFVSLHVPLTGATRHLIDAAALARMKPSAILVNTARGPVVDEAALASALESGHLAAAALDVFEREPDIDDRLRRLDRVLLTPHAASATEPTRAAMARALAEDILRVLSGQLPNNPLNQI